MVCLYKGWTSFAWDDETGGAKVALCIAKSTLKLYLVRHGSFLLFVQTS